MLLSRHLGQCASGCPMSSRAAPQSQPKQTSTRAQQLCQLQTLQTAPRPSHRRRQAQAPTPAFQQKDSGQRWISRVSMMSYAWVFLSWDQTLRRRPSMQRVHQHRPAIQLPRPWPLRRPHIRTCQLPWGLRLPAMRGYIVVGNDFGWLASGLFGRHY